MRVPGREGRTNWTTCWRTCLRPTPPPERASRSPKDPREVAEVFAGLLRPGGEFADRFEHVVFAVWDTAEGAPRHPAAV
ncbi:hypothetical protein [Actinomadura pelletieri]|uniref:hypothetical protein n=1 Tax=Actinomadura pelletieri TaxID=111805 RepID=UPI001FE6D8EB|nr:hypothetical protein [Actinomadura pelletieri]